MTDILALELSEKDWRAEQKAAADAEPARSRILGQIVDLDKGHYGWQIGWNEFQSEGRAAFWEGEGGTLTDAVESALNGMDVELAPGWWVMDGFTAHYSVDYWGEHDADYEIEDVRPAVWADVLHFLPHDVPWWVRLLRPVFRNRPVPSTFMEYRP